MDEIMLKESGYVTITYKKKGESNYSAIHLGYDTLIGLIDRYATETMKGPDVITYTFDKSPQQTP